MSNQDRQVQALGVLIEGVKKAFSKGAYTFEESGQLYNAVSAFIQSDNQEPTPVVVEETVKSQPAKRSKSRK